MRARFLLAVPAAVVAALLFAVTNCANFDPPAPLEEVVEALPLGPDTVRVAVIGDTGTGGRAQHEVAAAMARARERFPFEFVLMLGDNLYGWERPQDYRRKFEEPYAALLEAGVDFHASLGNHDDPNQRFYEPFHMGGERYYSFRRGPARFFALDSNYMDERQLAWLERELEGSDEPWKIAFFHHPLYSSGAKHGSELDLREELEPLLREHGVDVVFAGHEHFYERIVPQHGIHHFTSGAAAKLRRGNLRPSELTVRGLDSDYSFLLLEIDGDHLYYEAIARSGVRFDAGVVVERDALAKGRPVEDATPLPNPVDEKPARPRADAR